MTAHRKQHKIHAKALLPIIAALACLLPLPAHAGHKSAPAAKPATQYAANDTHPDERVTIAAEPCDDTHHCPFFRLPYLEHGLLPVRVIITNDGDRALQLDEARIQFLPATGERLPAATLDDINRRLFTYHSTKDIHIPHYPFPIHRTPIDKKVTDDDNDFGFPGTIVNAHSTLSGFLFYDIKELDDPALLHAELYVKMIHTMDGKQELFAFTIPFDKWLAANPNAPSNHPRK